MARANHSEPMLSASPEHDAGCTYGGFSCGHWLVAAGCSEYHPETHIVTDDRCPCGFEFPGFGAGKVVFDVDDRPLPLGLQQGIGTPIEREYPEYSNPSKRLPDGRLARVATGRMVEEEDAGMTTVEDEFGAIFDVPTSDWNARPAS